MADDLYTQLILTAIIPIVEGRSFGDSHQGLLARQRNRVGMFPTKLKALKAIFKEATQI